MSVILALVDNVKSLCTWQLLLAHYSAQQLEQRQNLLSLLNCDLSTLRSLNFRQLSHLEDELESRTELIKRIRLTKSCVSLDVIALSFLSDDFRKARRVHFVWLIPQRSNYTRVDTPKSASRASIVTQKPILDTCALFAAFQFYRFLFLISTLIKFQLMSMWENQKQPRAASWPASPIT